METLLRYGKPEDFNYIESLRDKESNALGFIPSETIISILENRPRLMTDNRIRYYHRNSIVLITQDNDDNTGYCYCSFYGDIVKIFQIVIQEDARRWHRALLLIDEIEKIAKSKQKIGISARVAVDLESNNFWKAAGYNIVNQTTSKWLNQKESKCKRPIYTYFKLLSSLYFEEVS